MAKAQANAAFYYAAGPVNVFVRIPSYGAGPFVPVTSLGGNVLFLGHCEDEPEPEFIQNWVPVKSALSGPAVPDDFMFAGAAYKVQLNLARFSYDVVNLLMASPQYGRGAAPGSETFLDRGRFLLANGDSFELWLQNAFFGTPNAAAYPNMPPGYYFPACKVGATYPKKLSRVNTRMMLGIEPVNVRQGVIGGWLGYSQDPKWFANLPLPG